MISSVLIVVSLILTILFIADIMPVGWQLAIALFWLAITWPIIRTQFAIHFYKKKYGYNNDKDALAHFQRDIIEYSQRKRNNTDCNEKENS